MSEMDTWDTVFHEHVSAEDIERSATLQSLDAIYPQVHRLAADTDSINSILDIGCRNGAFASAIGAYLQVDQLYGVDIDPSMVDLAASNGIEAYALDVEDEQFPLDDDSIDAVISFGLLEHLRYYDHLFDEITRVSPDGWLWLSSPNLGGWNNRLALLLGYQPRNVEVSQRRAVGTLSMYDPDEALDHVHAPTYRALRELLDLYGYRIEHTATLTPYQRTRLVTILDLTLGWRAAWARRLAVLAKR